MTFWKLHSIEIGNLCLLPWSQWMKREVQKLQRRGEESEKVKEKTLPTSWARVGVRSGEL